MLSKSAMRAFEKGYRVVNGQVIGLKGRPLKLKHYDHYPKFNFIFKSRSITVKVHQLVAWEKYGLDCIGKDVYVRHKDDDAYNFHFDNIILGTKKENFEDMRRNRQKADGFNTGRDGGN